MSVPGNYLLTPPRGERDPWGNSMHSSSLIKGLQQVNGSICVPQPNDTRSWLRVMAHYGGDGETSSTCIWLGDPKHGRKVTAFHLGMVPEWTQVGPPEPPMYPSGRIIRRGWRNILQRCEKHGVASRRELERIFRVNLDIGPPDQSCQNCRMDGKLTFNVHASGLCDSHERDRLDAAKYQLHKKDAVVEAIDRAMFAAKAPVSVVIVQA